MQIAAGWEPTRRLPACGRSSRLDARYDMMVDRAGVAMCVAVPVAIPPALGCHARESMHATGVKGRDRHADSSVGYSKTQTPKA